jgi:hypothetical protein
VQSNEFKPQSCQKKKRKKEKARSFHTLLLSVSMELAVASVVIPALATGHPAAQQLPMC